MLRIDCGSDFFRCDVTNEECVPLADACDAILDCTNGQDEAGGDVVTQCLNGGTRVDNIDAANTCECSSVRYSGETCEVDLGTPSRGISRQHPACTIGFPLSQYRFDNSVFHLPLQVI